MGSQRAYDEPRRSVKRAGVDGEPGRAARVRLGDRVGQQGSMTSEENEGGWPEQGGGTNDDGQRR